MNKKKPVSSNVPSDDFAKALYRLFFTKQNENTLYKERQQHKLSRALFFGQLDLTDQAANKQEPETKSARAHAKLQASLMGLNLEAMPPQTKSAANSNTPFTYYQQKLRAFQELQVLKEAMNDKGTPATPKMAALALSDLVKLNSQRALKYYYKLLYHRRFNALTKPTSDAKPAALSKQKALKEKLGKDISGVVNDMIKELKKEKVNAALIHDHLIWQTLVYKLVATGMHDVMHAEDKNEAINDLRAKLALFSKLKRLPSKVSQAMAKQFYRLLSYAEFNGDEYARLLTHIDKMIDNAIEVYATPNTEQDKKKKALACFTQHVQAIAKDVPMTLDPETGIQGILNTLHDLFAGCVDVCDKTYFLVVPWLLKWVLFKPLEQFFATFERAHIDKDPCHVMNNLLDAMQFENDDIKVAKQTIKSVVTREKFWRVFGYISAVAAAIGCGVVTAVALAALGGVPFLPVMVVGCLISGVIANYYLHKAYVPNTWMRFMEKGLFTTNGLNGIEITAMWTGVMLSFLASVAICAITYVGVNYALLSVGAKVGLFHISLSSLTFAAAATPWLLTPMGLLVAGLLAVSVFIAFETFVTNFPIYIRDYTNFIRERKWKNTLKFFHSFFGNSEQSTKERVGTTLYNSFLVLLVIGMTLSLGYFAMLPTSVAFGASVFAIVGVKWLYHGIVWGNMVANMPFVLENIYKFCDRTVRFLAGVGHGIVLTAKTLANKSKREGLKATLTWDNLMQYVREVSGIKVNATAGQTVLGGFVFIGVIVTLFTMVVLNAFGNGKVGQEGGEIIAQHAPFYLSDATAEMQVVGQSTALSYLFCYQAVFNGEDNADPAFMSSDKISHRATYAKLMQHCDPGGFEFKAPKEAAETVSEASFCRAVNSIVASTTA